MEEVTMGLTHRGRLNIMANVVGNSTERIFASFEGTVHPDFPADEGDVKYHQGAQGVHRTSTGHEVAITVPSNPSHLEAVDPVVEGMVRAKQDRRGRGPEAWNRALAVILHGDAAFAGQGMVAEVFNLAQLRGYRTGGSLHVIVNNQIGFTTPPAAGRSSMYSTDVAKINQVPIFHVNADDPEAAYRVLQIALDYRQEWHKDVVVDLIGFRLHGHNEGDEPTYTQPLMYKRIQEHPGVRSLYARRLVREGVLTEAEVDGDGGAAEGRVRGRARQSEGHRARRADRARAAPRHRLRPATAVDRDGVSRRNPRPHRPRSDDSALRVSPQPEDGVAARAPRRRWPTARNRSTGPRRRRSPSGRFSSSARRSASPARTRAAARSASATSSFTTRRRGRRGRRSRRSTPDRRRFEVYDSPLSEVSVLGFEYGYSVEAPEALVLWEAQYGDFANGAQVVIDQFVASAEDKWQQTTRLGLLLPHGYEGQGPEHSSARLERYLQLCAEDNLQVANVTTPAQYFHLLRRQMRQPAAQAARRLHAEEPAPPAVVVLAARGPDPGRLPDRDSRRGGLRPRHGDAGARL